MQKHVYFLSRNWFNICFDKHGKLSRLDSTISLSHDYFFGSHLNSSQKKDCSQLKPCLKRNVFSRDLWSHNILNEIMRDYWWHDMRHVDHSNIFYRYITYTWSGLEQIRKHFTSSLPILARRIQTLLSWLVVTIVCAAFVRVVQFLLFEIKVQISNFNLRLTWIFMLCWLVSLQVEVSWEIQDLWSRVNGALLLLYENIDLGQVIGWVKVSTGIRSRQSSYCQYGSGWNRDERGIGNTGRMFAGYYIQAWYRCNFFAIDHDKNVQRSCINVVLERHSQTWNVSICNKRHTKISERTAIGNLDVWRAITWTTLVFLADFNFLFCVWLRDPLCPRTPCCAVSVVRRTGGW